MENFFLSYITIGVTDLATLKQFYCKLFGIEPFKETESYFFIKPGNINLAFCAWDYLQKKNIPISKGNGNILLSINVLNEESVNKIYTSLVKLNATILQQPTKLSNKCYNLYFTDNENNRWEIIYNPGFKV